MNRAPRWAESPEAAVKYREARADAQRRANETGFDHGIEASEPLKEWHVFMLPSRSTRFGFERRAEVVSCEDLSRCRPGHGPVRP